MHSPFWHLYRNATRWRCCISLWTLAPSALSARADPHPRSVISFLRLQYLSFSFWEFTKLKSSSRCVCVCVRRARSAGVASVDSDAVVKFNNRHRFCFYNENATLYGSVSPLSLSFSLSLSFFLCLCHKLTFARQCWQCDCEKCIHMSHTHVLNVFVQCSLDMVASAISVQGCVRVIF